MNKSEKSGSVAPQSPRVSSCPCGPLNSQPSTLNTKAILITNPNAGGVGDSARLSAIAPLLRRAGLDVTHLSAPTPGEIAPALRASLSGRSPEDTRVVIAGGDGTVNAALPALADTGFPLAVIPLGTLNILAKELGVPRHIETAASIAAAGHAKKIDLGLANHRLFALMTGLGLDGEIVRSIVPAHRKRLRHYGRYLARALRLLSSYPPCRFYVEGDSFAFESNAWMAITSNSAFYAHHWRPSPAARMDDGLLDLCLFERGPAPQTVGQVLSLVANRHPHFPGVRHLRSRAFRFSCDPPVSMQMDGDTCGSTPAQIKILPQALTVITPGGN